MDLVVFEYLYGLPINTEFLGDDRAILIIHKYIRHVKLGNILILKS
jgi:hypothetical protein